MSELRDPPESDDFEWVNAWANGTSPAKGDTPKQAPAPEAASATDLAERPAPQQTIAPVRVAAEAQSREAIVHEPADIVAPKPAVTAQPSFADRVARVSRKREPDADQFVHPATRRFFAALRTPASAPHGEAPAAAMAPADAQSHQPMLATAPASPVAMPSEALPAPAPATAGTSEPAVVVTPAEPATTEPAKVESAEASLAPESLAPEASQLERDIAEIECARDALVDPAPFTIADPRKARSRFSILRHAESVPILVGSVVGATLLIVFGAAASLISLR